MELFNIAGKKAIVTGGTRGLGYGMAEGLMEAGCEVVIVGTSDKVYDVAKGFCDRGFKCHGVKADFSKREQVYQGFNDCVAALGGDLDIIVNAHGIQRRHSAEVFPIEEWDEVLNVNLNSVFILCQEARNRNLGSRMCSHHADLLPPRPRTKKTSQARSQGRNTRIKTGPLQIEQIMI